MRNNDHILNRLVCPECRGALASYGNSNIQCAECKSIFAVTVEGYIDFVGDSEISGKVSTTEKKAEAQASAAARRIDDEYIKPYLNKEPFERILDVGCGVGRLVTSMVSEGYEAYGVDLPCLSPYWKQAGNARERFFCSAADKLPFPDSSFDVVISMGVIEHIGTGVGHCTLSENYWRLRQGYADELLRVTAGGGRIMISCPNKHFPVDLQHEVKDQFTPRTFINSLRENIYSLTGLNVHKVWGRYHLLSYAEVKRLFCESGYASSCKPLPLKGLFGFDRMKSGAMRPIGRAGKMYLELMPAIIRPTFLNPYLLVEIRK